MKYAVVTFGCRVNQADSLGFEEDLLTAGAEATSPERADLVIVNTCSVTATADQGARQTIRRVARDNPSARIVVTGCYATRRPDEVSALPNVTRVVANDDKPRLLKLIADDPSTAERFGDGDGACGSAIQPGVAGRTAYTLRVQTGCGEPCAYCIIPSTRGAPRSVPIGNVLREVDRVAAAGFKEIALTGVHLGSHGRDLSPRSSLVDLLEALDVHTARPKTVARRRVRLKADTTYSSDADVRRVRLQPDPQPDLLFRVSSLEPMDCTPDVVDLVGASPAFAPHFHLPLQHASDRMLRAMRRPYTAAYYADLVDGIRARLPDASIGSDIIVGFPGETDEDVEQLAGYLERSPLTHVHVFPYSDRPGTAATALPHKVHGAAIRERARRIRDIGARLTSRFRNSQIGATHRALTIEDGSLAVTGNYLKVRIGPGHVRNQWIAIGISRLGDSGILEGERREPLSG
jgi:threonylcarbamoyladenosine tRNA methylthiotransferase MtaB